MWTIYEKKTLLKVIKKLPKDIISKYEVWKRIIELQGPKGLKSIKGFHDEALKGQWKGYRSSRLSYKWRVIYKIEDDYFDIFVIDIMPHKY